MTEINYKEILNQIRPEKDEKEKFKSLSGRLIRIINENARENGINAQAVLVGSVAKETWLSGKADVDIFIKFPLNTPQEYLKEKGLSLGRNCIKRMDGTWEYRYASHPYITGKVNDLEIDFVPCYDIRKTKKIKSAVDRTIPHTEYVKENLTSQEADEVLLLKCFMKTIDTYGSEFKVGGFAGYLCELLIIHYGTFLKVLESAGKEWKPGYQIDLMKYGTAHKFSEPLIVVDPVDSNRNVAAALSLQKMSEFVVASRNFLKKPSPSYFKEKEIPTDLNHIKESFKKRETKTLLLSFNAPNIPADALYPQIEKTANSLVRLVERKGFRIFGSAYWTDEKEKILILLEFETWKLPSISKHQGPPVWSAEHEEKFLEKYKNRAWIEEDRWVARVEREYTKVEDLIKTALSREEIGLLKFGKHIKNNILNEYELINLNSFLVADEVQEEILEFFYLYLHKNINLWPE